MTLALYYTDENGQFQLTGLRDGWYKVTEQEPPTGYAIKEATQEVYIKSGTGKVLTFENIPLSALVVWKYDSVTGAAVQRRCVSGEVSRPAPPAQAVRSSAPTRLPPMAASP